MLHLIVVRKCKLNHILIRMARIKRTTMQVLSKDLKLGTFIQLLTKVQIDTVILESCWTVLY